MNKELKDKITFVTGGASGIGKAIVETFCKVGAEVIFCDINQQLGDEVSLSLKDYKCTFVKTDISDTKELENTVTRILKEKGRIDIVINNAGISPFSSILKTSIVDFDKTLKINLYPIFTIAKLLVEHREVNKDYKSYGRIVNMASTRYLMSEPNSESYAASKGAIVSLTHALAISLGKYNFTVNCISPGWIETANYSSLTNADHLQHPVGRVGKPEDIAQACLFFCNPQNDFITGQNLIVDGGMTKKMIYNE